ncbi:MAG: hypothetical protein K1X47_07850 [Cyclobacteriaceae bacterium]|nr:hypothetical protein [Cyclobacteriaceae bacterium]
MVEEVDKRSTADKIYAYDDEFRDTLTTVDAKGKRVWLYPKKPSGKFTNYRIWLSYLYFVILFGLPFIKVNGEPFFLFNIIERNFIIFGMHFGPQDFYLFAIAMLIIATMIFNRVERTFMDTV